MSERLTFVGSALTIPGVAKRVPQFVSVPELARDLGMEKSTLFWYLERVKAKTEALGTARNSVRFVRRDQVVDIVTAIEAYRTRRPAGLTTADVAARLGIAPSTARVLASTKRLRTRHSGKRLIFNEADVERYARGRPTRRPAA